MSSCGLQIEASSNLNSRLLANFSAEKQTQLPSDMWRSLFSYIFFQVLLQITSLPEDTMTMPTTILWCDVGVKLQICERNFYIKEKQKNVISMREFWLRACLPIFKNGGNFFFVYFCLDTWCYGDPPCAYSGLIVDSFFYVNFYHIWSQTNICSETPRNYRILSVNPLENICCLFWIFECITVCRPFKC